MPGLLLALSIGWLFTAIAIALPLIAFGGGLWLIWTGYERKRWWVVRLLAGAPLLAYGGFGIVYMTL